MHQEPAANVLPRRELAILAAIAGIFVIFHTLTNGQYGLHRDELQVLDDARHLDWGFVPYPPLTPLIERIALVIFGGWLPGLRLFSALAQSGVIFFSGFIARELGGKRLAQIIAALAVAAAPLVVFEGTEFQYTSFELFWCVLAVFFILRAINTENPRWCAPAGAALGLGLLTKYSVAFFIAGIAAGIVLTPMRRWVKSGWLWCGAGIAFAIVLPNLLWQVRHHFVWLDFIRHIHARDIGEGRMDHFLADQFVIPASSFTIPLWIAGLVYLFFARAAKPYRILAWMYAAAFAIYFFAKGRGYYTGSLYPMLLAAGAVCETHWLAARKLAWSRAVSVATFALIAAGLVLSVSFLVPILPPDSPHNFAIRKSDDLREEIGWQELVATVGGIRDSLSPAERSSFAILAANYGEVGAIDYYGPAYGLPPAISGVNSVWQRGYGSPPPRTLIVLGLSRRFVERNFQSCRLAGHDSNRYGIHNEESDDHPDIFVCGPPFDPWPVYWADFRYYG